VQVLLNERIEVSAAFFDEWLNGGRALVLLDGLDEVANLVLGRRVLRLVDASTRAYPDCRYVVASRIVGYTEASQLPSGAGFVYFRARRSWLASSTQNAMVVRNTLSCANAITSGRSSPARVSRDAISLHSFGVAALAETSRQANWMRSRHPKATPGEKRDAADLGFFRAFMGFVFLRS
jgi:hypothetical protein